jgi:hypothetical protein
VSAADHHTYRVHWSAEDEEYVGTVAELPSVSWLDPDRMEAFTGPPGATTAPWGVRGSPPEQESWAERCTIRTALSRRLATHCRDF